MRNSDWSSDVCSSDLDLAGGSSAVAVTLADALTVQGGVNGATGIFLGDGTTQVLDLAGPVNIQSNGGLATGVRSGNSSGNVQIVSRDTLSVTNSDGGARTEGPPSELQSQMSISLAVFGLKKKK